MKTNGIGRASGLGLAVAALLAAAPAAAAGPEELVLAIGGESEQGYDPTLGWGRYGHPLFQSTLLTRDAGMETQPELAVSWELSEDRLTWTIEIRDGVRFSDGTPLTAEDVAFTFKTAAHSGGLLDLTVMEEAEALDDTTVEIRLSEPRITFATSFYTLGIVPAASYGPSYARNPVGSGPYRLVSWSEGEQLIVEANPHFYGEPPAFRRLTFLFTSEDTSFAAAAAGEADVVAVPAQLAAEVPDGMKAVVADTVDNRGIAFPMRPDEGERTQAGAPIGNDVTSDRAIRRAINIGISRELLVEVALHGHGTPAYGPADGLPWGNPEAAERDGDPEAAIAILEDAGWIPGEDGVRQKDGVEARFRLVYPASDSTRRMLAVTTAEMLRPLGIAAEPTGLSWEEIERVQHAQPVLFGWGSHSPVEVYYLYDSALMGQDFYNTGLYSNPAVDAWFDKAQGAGSMKEANRLWRKAAWDGKTGYGMKGDAAWAWLVNLDHIYFVDECLDLGRLQIEPHGHGWPITAGILNWTWTCP